tara:strand:- start:179 stop:445 length:267 start_codon:yes stop_codon:yes gene_type:complete
MIKELKIFFYIIIIFVFIFFTINYYFSEQNQKKSYRAFESIDKKTFEFAKKLPLLKNDTDNIVEYVENIGSDNKKKYNFWNLLINDKK